MNKMVLAPTTLPTCTPLEYIAAASDAGYDGIGMRLYRQSPTAPFTPIVGNPALMREVKQAVDSAGLQVHDAFSCYLRPETDLEGLKPVLEYAADLGASYAVVICDDTEWARAADNLGRIADLAAAARLTAVVEGPIYGRLINTLPLVLKLVNDAGRENIVVCIDTYQLFRSGDDVALLGQQAPSTLPYLQLTDGNAEPVQFLVPGSGSVPLRQILDQLPSDVTIALECPAPKDSDVRPAEWARTLLAGAREVVNRGSNA